MTPALLKKVRAALLAVDGVMEGSSIFGNSDEDRAFFVNGKQIANAFGEDHFELRLTRKVVSAHRTRLKADERVILRGGDWISLRITTPKDAAHAPPEGAVAKLPPTGAELARRRRFH
jgi:hypothetical protein